MSVTNYVDAFKRVKQERDTLELTIKKAFIEGAETLKTNEIYDFSSLKDDAKREAFVRATNKTLEDYVVARTPGMDRANFDGLDIFDRARLMRGMYGFSYGIVNRVVDYYKGSLNMDQFMKEIDEPLSTVISDMNRIPITLLTDADAEEVVKFTRTHATDANYQANPDVKIDHAQLTRADMDYLLRTYLLRSVITPDNIEGKPYRVQ